MDDLVFEKIYGETSRPLWAYVFRVSGDPASVDDILQEAYLSFLRSPFRGTVKEAKPYLYKIATNLIYKGFHKSQRRNEVRIDDADITETPGEAGELLELSQTFARLNERERSLLWLAYVDGYEHKDIATILNINSLSVRVLLFRAKQKLAALLEAKTK